MEAIAYHEGIPGHHLQFSIAQEQTDLPAFRRFASYNAYSEGWAFYAERLGKEVGFYQDPYSEYGRLENEMWRSVRLVVDTGVHAKHWSRQQMVDFFRQHTAMDEPNIETEVDRYIAWPGITDVILAQSGAMEMPERNATIAKGMATINPRKKPFVLKSTVGRNGRIAGNTTVPAKTVMINADAGIHPPMSHRTIVPIIAGMRTLLNSTGTSTILSRAGNCTVLISGVATPFFRNRGRSLALTGPYSTWNPENLCTSLADTPGAPTGAG